MRTERDRRQRTNERIRAREIRVIDENGEQLGIMTPAEALAIAKEKDLDLIEVAPQAKPPVCRIMDFGRWKYEQRKREKEAQRQSKTAELKTVRLRPHTDDHDFATKTRRARRFLEEGKKVRVLMLFRGRELMHQNLARDKVLRMAEDLKDVSDIERRPSVEGRQMSMILHPKSAAEIAAVKKAREAQGIIEPEPEDLEDEDEEDLEDEEGEE